MACQLAPPVTAEPSQSNTSKLHAVPSGPSSYFVDSIPPHQDKGKGKARESPGDVERSARRERRYHSPDPLNLPLPAPSPLPPSKKPVAYRAVSPSTAAAARAASPSRAGDRVIICHPRFNPRLGPGVIGSRPQPKARPAPPSTSRPQSHARPAPPAAISRPDGRESNARPGPSTIVSDQARDVRQVQGEHTTVYGAVKHVLDWMDGICPICYIFGSTELQHDIFDCPEGVCSNLTPYGTFKKSYATASLKRIKGCWRCFAPHAAPVSHPRGKDVSCITEAIKPILYAIFVIPDLKRAIFKRANMSMNSFSTLDSYKQWLVEVEEEEPVHGILNMYRLLYFFFQICEAGELATDGKFAHPPH